MMKSYAPVNVDQPQRYMVVMIPDWAMASLGMAVPPGALAVTAHRGRVVDATLYARRAGVRVGMRVKSAQLLVPHLVILSADPQAEATRFEAVLRALETQVAQARMVVPGVAWTLARGPARWHGSEELAAEALIDAVSEYVGVESRVGIATGTASALLAAQRGEIIPDGEQASYLSDVPVAQMVSLIPQGRARYGELVTQLELLGVATCGNLLACDDRAYYARFGRVFGELHALACGGDVFFPDGQRYLDELNVTYECDEPEIYVERLMIPMTRLAQQMTRKLELQGVSAGAMLTRLKTYSGQEYERRWGQVDATGGDAIVQRILWHIQSLMSHAARSNAHIGAERNHATGRIHAGDTGGDTGVGVGGVGGIGGGAGGTGGDIGRAGGTGGGIGGCAGGETMRGRWGDYRNVIASGADDVGGEEDLGVDGVSSIEVCVSDLCDTTVDSPLWGVTKRRVERERSIEHVTLLLGENAVLFPSIQGAFDPRHRVVLRPWGAPLAEVAPQGGEWEGKVDDPPEIICIPPTPVCLYEAPAPVACPTGRQHGYSGATIIAFPGMDPAGQHAQEHPPNTGKVSVRIDAWGMLSCYHALMVLNDQPAPSQLRHWSQGQRIHVTLRDPVWTVRGRWWEKPQSDDAHAPRSYVRACTHDGVELLLVCRGKEWCIEGMYDRRPRP